MDVPRILILTVAVAAAVQCNYAISISVVGGLLFALWVTGSPVTRTAETYTESRLMEEPEQHRGVCRDTAFTYSDDSIFLGNYRKV